MTTRKPSDANDTTTNDAVEQTPAKSPRKTAAKKSAPKQDGDSAAVTKKTPARAAKNDDAAPAKTTARKSAAQKGPAAGDTAATGGSPEAATGRKTAAKPRAASKSPASAKSKASQSAARTTGTRKTGAKDSASAPQDGTAPASVTSDKNAEARAANTSGTDSAPPAADAPEKTAKTPRKTAATTPKSSRSAASGTARGRKSAAAAGKDDAPKTAPDMTDAHGPADAAPAKAPEAPAGAAALTKAAKADGAKPKAASKTPSRAASAASKRSGRGKTAAKAASGAAPAGDGASAPVTDVPVASAPAAHAPHTDTSAAPGASGPGRTATVEPHRTATGPAGASQSGEPADFPTGFGDLAPEDYFTSQDGEAADAGEEQSGRKRRSRSRRGGRGRKKSSASAAAAETAASGDGAEDGVAAAAAMTDGDAEERDDDAPDITHDAVHDEEFDDDDDGEPGKKGGQKRGKDEKGPKGRRKMFVSVLPEEQIEVVITEEGQVQEYYVEMLHQAKTKGNIYKATVHNVDPNLQAAFVSYGAVKNGFLQIDEVHPEYYVAPHDANKGRKYPPIQKVLKPGQELLVQVVKEPAGTKGAFLTTYLSMPGRFLVLTPGREQIGVSRKVDDDGERARLRELLEGLVPGPGLGVIVRTVSMGASKTSLQRDLQFLKRTWKEVRAKGTTEKAPCLVYQEMDLTSRAVRDYLTDAIGEVWIDDEATAGAVNEIAEALFPRKNNLVRLHKDLSISLFERFNLQRQLDQIHSREVTLPSGGRLVIDPTEALTAIDINSGRSSGKNNFEDMAYRTNMEAAKMIPLQLRLRDIGGQVVADFIEMRDKSHWREVEKTLRNGMKVDRARYDVGKIGPFGLLEIVRQRLGSSAISISTEPCPCCNGTGVRRNMEWQSQSALRDILRLLRGAQAQNQPSVTYEADQGVAMHLLNHKRQRLLDMEQQYGVHLDIRVRVSQTE